MSVTIALVVLTFLVSYQCFENPDLFNKLKHWPFVVKRNGEYYRFLTSGFVHQDWWHLGINMFVLYGFGEYIEHMFVHEYFGPVKGRLIYLLLYLVAIVASDLPTYFARQDDSYYASIGASGAVSAILFAFVLLNPWQLIYLYMIIPIPAIIAAVAYLVYSSWAPGNIADNVNHSAHFYGAVFGFFGTIALRPSLFMEFVEKLMNIPYF